MYKYIKSLAKHAENNATKPMLSCMRIATVSFMVAALGYCIALFINYSFGHFIVGIGVIVGFICVVTGNFLTISESIKNRNNYKAEKEKYLNSKNPWDK